MAALVASCGDSAPRLERVLRLPRDGLVVRYPKGWTSTTRNDTFVPNPALCFAVRNAPRRVEVKLVEYLPPLLTERDLREVDPVTRQPMFRRRPRHLSLRLLEPSDNSWTRGQTLDFQANGRVFYVGVTRPGRDVATREIEAILDSVRVGRGRCRPSAGVGAAGRKP